MTDRQPFLQAETLNIELRLVAIAVQRFRVPPTVALAATPAPELILALFAPLD